MAYITRFESFREVFHLRKGIRVECEAAGEVCEWVRGGGATVNIISAAAEPKLT